MSGIEVAGLLLGALPILFTAVDLAKESIQKGRVFFRKRVYVEKLAYAVLLQQQTLAETVRSLLIRSGCEAVSSLDDDPVGYLNDESVRNQVLDYLGPQNDAAFTGALKQSNDIVKKIARNIAGLVSAVTVCFTHNVLQESLRLRRFIYGNRTPPTTYLKLSRRIKIKKAAGWT